MPIYCEGALKAEITFSLTGGREGKLISENPPVEIYVDVDFNRVQIASYTQASGNSPKIYETPFFDDYSFSIPDEVDSFNFREESRVDVRAPGVQDKRFIVFKTYYRGSDVIEKILFDTGWDYTYIAWGLKELRNGEPYFPVKKGVVIQDSLNTLYAHALPEGFPFTYSVNCIGCGNGECAGGNGKGGVICMDCQKVKNDLNVIKGYLK